MRNENGSGNNGAIRRPVWWAVVPAGERAVICDIMGSLRGLKRSGSWQVARAARKWERCLTCFIKFQLMGGANRRKGHLLKVEKQKTESRNDNRC